MISAVIALLTVAGGLAVVRAIVWRRAVRSVARKLPLGSDGIVIGAESLLFASDTGEGRRRAGEMRERGRGEGRARAALLLHGFGDTPQSLQPLAAGLSEAGWLVSAPLLPGHGRTLAAFAASRAADWLLAAERAYDELRGVSATVVVCGQSMGAALGVRIAAKRDIRGLVLLAPYLVLPTSARAAAAFHRLVGLVLPAFSTSDARSILDPAARRQSKAYGFTTPRLLAELKRIVDDAGGNLERVRAPTLIVHSRTDNRISAEAVAAAVARIGHAAKAVHWLEGSGHVVAVDYRRGEVVEAVVKWLDAMATTRSGVGGGSLGGTRETPAQPVRDA
ncbi:MAG: alpha/beta hydrolase [Gemmatimonadaceae bacterium]